MYSFCVTAPAQVVEGFVRDRENNKPLINAAVRNASSPMFVTFTDTAGYFILEAFPNNDIEISYLGYVTASLKAAAIKKHKAIYLFPNAVSLPEITVIANSNQLLLEKSYTKLIKNLALDTSIVYLWHGIEENPSILSFIESYAKYTATMVKKRSKIINKLYLLQLRHPRQENIDSSFVLQNHLFNVGFYPSFSNNSFPMHIVKREETDCHILLTCYPNVSKQKKLNTNSMNYAISKKDTVLQSIYSNSIDSLCLQQKYTRTRGRQFKVISQQFNVSFENTPNGYYLKQCNHSVIALFRTTQGAEEVVRSINTTYALPEKDVSNAKKNSITGWSKELQKKEDTTDSDFWMDYLKNGEEASISE